MSKTNGPKADIARTVVTRIFGPIRSNLIAFVEGVTQAHQLYSDYTGLNAMSKYELAAMGFNRADIPALVTGAHERARSSVSGVVQLGRQNEPPPSSCRTASSSRENEQVYSHTDSLAAQIVDVRSLVPAQRHVKIFTLVEELKPGTFFILVNDHDPKPLYYELYAKYPKQFAWIYVDQGPEVWRAVIGKLPNVG